MVHDHGNDKGQRLPFPHSPDRLDVVQHLEVDEPIRVAFVLDKKVNIANRLRQPHPEEKVGIVGPKVRLHEGIFLEFDGIHIHHRPNVRRQEILQETARRDGVFGNFAEEVVVEVAGVVHENGSEGGRKIRPRLKITRASHVQKATVGTPVALPFQNQKTQMI
jgi:hypothetical protein